MKVNRALVDVKTFRRSNGSSDGLRVQVALSRKDVEQAGRQAEQLSLMALVPPRAAGGSWQAVDLGKPRPAPAASSVTTDELVLWQGERQDGFSAKELMSQGAAFGLRDESGNVVEWLQQPSDNFPVRDGGLAAPSSQVIVSDGKLKARDALATELKVAKVARGAASRILALRDALAEGAANRASVPLKVTAGQASGPRGTIAGWELDSPLNNPKFEEPTGGALAFSLRALDANGTASLFASVGGPARRTGDGWFTDGAAVTVSGASVPEISLGTIGASSLLQ